MGVRQYGLLVLSLLVAAPAGAQPSPKKKPASKKPGTVLTFYGLRKLEQDPKVSDEEKMREWQAFIERASDQIQYAKKAVVQWKDAAKTRVMESAAKDDQNPDLLPRQKANKWKEVLSLYPRTKEARQAQKRVAFWSAAETKRLAEAAEAVEKSRKPKVERIKAWKKVLEWVSRGPEARAAEKRIRDLQDQMFAEARSVDRIERVDNRTKLEAWRDVLQGRPTPAQKKLAKKRVAELEAELAQDSRRRLGQRIREDTLLHNGFDGTWVRAQDTVRCREPRRFMKICSSVSEPNSGHQNQSAGVERVVGEPGWPHGQSGPPGCGPVNL